MKRLIFNIFLIIFAISALFSGEYKSGKALKITDSIKTDMFVASDYLSVSAPIMGDLWSASGNTIIENTSAGNVYIASGDISISGAKFNSAILMGGEIKFQGNISGGLKIAGGNIRISGIIEKDVIVAGGKVIIEKDAVIKGDLIVAGGNVEIFGTVEGDLRGSFDSFELYGFIKKNVFINVDEKLFVDDLARVDGNFSYKSKKEFDINRNTVIGNINYTKIYKTENDFGRILILFKLFGLVGALVVALVLLAFAKNKIQPMLSKPDNFNLITLAIGLAGVVGLPIVVILLFALFVTIPLSIVIILLACVLFYIGKILLAMYIGSKLLFLINKKEAGIYLSALVGVVVLFGSFLIPYLGFVIYLIASIWGFGIGCKFIYGLFTKAE